MRYFFALFVLSVVAVLGFAGFRGNMSRKPPIEVFPDMDRQLKLRPQDEFSFFADGRSSRVPVAGTVSHSKPYNLPTVEANAKIYPYEDVPANTGRITGTTNFVETGPFELTSQFMARGQQRFQIYCFPCHGPLADGNGVTKKLGMATVANLHDPRIVQMPDGEIFSIITNGKSLMGSYAAQVDVEDRWAIIAYLRALQYSSIASVNDVPDQFKSNLKK